MTEAVFVLRELYSGDYTKYWEVHSPWCRPVCWWGRPSPRYSYYSRRGYLCPCVCDQEKISLLSPIFADARGLYDLITSLLLLCCRRLHCRGASCLLLAACCLLAAPAVRSLLPPPPRLLLPSAARRCLLPCCLCCSLALSAGPQLTPSAAPLCLWVLPNLWIFFSLPAF